MSTDHRAVLDGFFMPSVSEVLVKLQDDSPFIPSGMLFDVYLLVDASGRPNFAPDEELLSDLDRSSPGYWSDRQTLAEKKDYLRTLSTSNYMKALVGLGDAMKAVRVFVEHAKQAALASAAKGKHLLDSTGNVDEYHGSYVSDADMAQAYKSMSESLVFDNFMQQQEALMGMTDDDIAAAFAAEGWGVCNTRTSTTSPSRALTSAIVEKAKKLPVSYPALINSLNKLKDALGVVSEVQDSDTDQAKKRSASLDELDKISTADPTDLLQDTFEKMVVDRSLTIQQDQEEKKRTSHVFIVLDVSGSMSTKDLGGCVCRGFAANVLLLGLINLTGKSGVKTWVMTFEGVPGPTKSATTRDEAVNLARWVATINYDGGGTDIEAAVLKAYKITSESGEYDKADIVLITDGVSPLTSRLVTEKPARTKLRTLLVSRDASRRDLTPLLSASDFHAQLDWDSKTDSLVVGNSLQGVGGTK